MIILDVIDTIEDLGGRSWTTRYERTLYRLRYGRAPASLGRLHAVEIVQTRWPMGESEEIELVSVESDRCFGGQVRA